MAYADPLDERNRAARRKHYENNKAQYIERRHRVRQDIKAYIRSIKDVPCMDCGQRYPPYVMDLDHRPGEVKLCNPAQLHNYGSWSKVRAEIVKCDVVCANCHRIRTHERGSGTGLGNNLL